MWLSAHTSCLYRPRANHCPHQLSHPVPTPAESHSPPTPAESHPQPIPAEPTTAHPSWEPPSAHTSWKQLLPTPPKTHLVPTSAENQPLPTPTDKLEGAQSDNTTHASVDVAYLRNCMNDPVISLFTMMTHNDEKLCTFVKHYSACEVKQAGTVMRHESLPRVYVSRIALNPDHDLFKMHHVSSSDFSRVKLFLGSFFMYSVCEGKHWLWISENFLKQQHSQWPCGLSQKQYGSKLHNNCA